MAAARPLAGVVGRAASVEVEVAIKVDTGRLRDEGAADGGVARAVVAAAGPLRAGRAAAGRAEPVGGAARQAERRLPDGSVRGAGRYSAAAARPALTAVRRPAPDRDAAVPVETARQVFDVELPPLDGGRRARRKAAEAVVASEAGRVGAQVLRPVAHAAAEKARLRAALASVARPAAVGARVEAERARKLDVVAHAVAQPVARARAAVGAAVLVAALPAVAAGAEGGLVWRVARGQGARAGLSAAVVGQTFAAKHVDAARPPPHRSSVGLLVKGQKSDGKTAHLFYL